MVDICTRLTAVILLSTGNKIRDLDISYPLRSNDARLALAHSLVGCARGGPFSSIVAFMGTREGREEFVVHHLVLLFGREKATVFFFELLPILRRCILPDFRRSGDGKVFIWTLVCRLVRGTMAHENCQ